MEWMAIIGDSIQYIEENITEDVTADEVAKAVGVSPFYLGYRKKSIRNMTYSCPV